MDYKYLPLIPKSLLDDFLHNKVIPFVGAGFSKNADIPEGLSMPDWNELGKIAASEINDYVYDNSPIDALSYYESLYSRAKLVEFLKKSLHHGYVRPSETYRSFCDLFTGIICTTNFDSLLEDELTLLHRPVSIIVTEDGLTVENINESKILKLHGDFNHPAKMVITENDYDMYMENNPVFCTYIANLFITNTMLLVGYSLEDNDFRSIWKIINSRLGGMAQPAYCLGVGMSKEKIDRYGRRNIRVINIEGDPRNYKTILNDFFKEITDYLQGERDKKATSRDRKINEQMSIPAEDNRLCYISCPASRMEPLSELLFPILNEFGITPVRFVDMELPGCSVIETSMTAIRKSKGAIVDVSDNAPYGMFELGCLFSEMKPENVLLLCEKGKFPPSDIAGRMYIPYSFDMIYNNNEMETFKENIHRWVHDVYYNPSDLSNETFGNAQRLLDKCEYSACIVSAYAELETFIMNRYKDPWTQDYGPMYVMSMLADKVKEKNSQRLQIFKHLLDIKNKIVHQNYQATKEEATQFFELAKQIMEEAKK